TFLRASTFWVAADLSWLIYCPYSFFCPLGTFLNSAKKWFRRPFFPKYLMRKASSASGVVAVNFSTSTKCSLMVSIIGAGIMADKFSNLCQKMDPKSQTAQGRPPKGRPPGPWIGARGPGSGSLALVKGHFAIRNV